MRKIISNIALWGGMVACGMLLASCGDRDFFNPNNKADQYAANWEQKIGAIDPNQDWSMATTVKATINVAAAGDGVLSIYTENPVHSTAKLLAKAFLDNGTGNVTFDAIKGTEQVFVIARNNGKNVVYGWADIVNGTVDAGKTVAKKAAKTRAGEYCPVTKGETIELTGVGYTTSESAEERQMLYHWGSSTGKTVEDWIEEYKNILEPYINVPNTDYVVRNNVYYKLNDANKYPFKFESIVSGFNGEDVASVITSYSFDNYELINNDWTIVTESGAEKHNIAITKLDNVEKTESSPWILSWGKELFGTGGFFEEGKAYNDATKKALTGYDLGKVEQGISVKTTVDGSEILMPLMYGVTGGWDTFGYVYYKDGEDPLLQPHYLLIEDGRPSQNIKYTDQYQGKIAVGDQAFTGMFSWALPETELYGTIYKLAYFGENHNQAASYAFPKDVNIVFFIIPATTTWIDGKQVPVYDNNSYPYFSYSLPELNKRIGHTGANDANDTNKGNVKSTAWVYNGITFFGFEDYTDNDLNDIVFWLEGDFKPNKPLPEVPSTTQPKEEYTSWILACEDLGSTDDYDFNDIVLEVRTKIESEETFEGSTKTAETFKKATLEVRCLAAGGIYEANIYYNNTWIGESHNLLGGRVGTMINTEQLGRFSDWITLETITDKDAWNNIGDAWAINNVAKKIKIVVTIDEKLATSALIKAPGFGDAPQMITVPGDWLWPAERKRIEEAYRDFPNWNENSNNIEWYKKCESGLVIKR